jgi:predicted RecB family endonuclease
VSTPLPQLHEGRDGDTQFVKLVNQLRLYGFISPGTTWSIASEDVSAFKCVSRDASTDTIVLARADGSNYATGVIAADVRVGELAQVITEGVVLGAVSGRTAGDVVWVGTDGSLVFSAPATGYVLPIAVCVSATDIYVNPGTPSSSIGDSASFHFYIDETSGALGWPNGVLVPSSITAITFLPGQVGFVPSASKVYRSGQLTLNIRTNAMAGGETYSVTVAINSVAINLIIVAAGVTGPLSLTFATGSTAPTDYYSVLVGGNANFKEIEYTAVLRLFT